MATATIEARSTRPFEATTEATAAWAAPLILFDGRVYDVVKAEVEKPEKQPVDQSIVMQRCLIELQGKHQRSTLRFEIRAYPTAFRRRLLDLHRSSTLVLWARQWIAQYLSQTQRHAQGQDHWRVSDGSIVVECW